MFFLFSASYIYSQILASFVHTNEARIKAFGSTLFQRLPLPAGTSNGNGNTSLFSSLFPSDPEKQSRLVLLIFSGVILIVLFYFGFGRLAYASFSFLFCC
jgi:hypothetical protein